VRDPVAREELAQSARVGRQPRSDEPQTCRPPDQQRAPGNKRAQDQIAELLVGGDHPAQLTDAEHDHLGVLRGDGRQVGGLTREEIGAAPETALSDHADRTLRRRAVILIARERSANHHAELVPDLAGASEDLALRERASLTRGREQRDLLASEAREGVLVLELRVPHPSESW
jgi:hypothetical protein